MGKRSTARRLAMQALYQADVGGSDIDWALKEILEEGMPKEGAAFAEALAKGAWGKKEEIDKIIENFLKDWPLERIGKVDRSILRLAIYELNYLKETPPAVVIDEAVELAKRYVDNEAAKFINGVLGAVLKGQLNKS